MYNINQSNMEQVLITKLELFDAGSFNPMYARPYEFNANGYQVDNLKSRMEQNGAMALTSELFQGIAGGIVAPSSNAQHQIAIPMGWNMKRMRFVMNVECRRSNQLPAKYIFQGYTSHADNSMMGTMDPEMDFFINSYIQVADREVMTPQGPRYDQVIVASHQVINGRIVSDPTVGDSMCLRPMDMFTGISTGYIEQALNSHNPYKATTINAVVSNQGDSKASKRQHGIASNYLHNIVSSYDSAKELAGFGQNTEDFVSRARALTIDPELIENSFFRRLSETRGMINSSFFKLRDLRNIDMNVDLVSTYYNLSPAKLAQLPQAGQDAQWHTNEYETIWASALSAGLPSIMIDLLISQVQFLATNQSSGGQIEVILGKETYAMTTANMQRNFDMFRMRLANEILKDLSYMGTIFQIKGKFSVYGHSTLEISLDGRVVYPFTAPSFSDGLFAPTHTSSNDHRVGLVNNFENLINHLPSANAGTFNAALSGI